MHSDTRVQLNDVSYSYEEQATPALSGVSAVIQPGEFVAVLGHNGSGKSTMAKLLNALYVPTEGNVLVCGYDTREEKYVWEIRQRAGMIFQNPDNQIVATVVKEDVAFGLENLGVPTEEMLPRIESALSAVRMSKYADKAPHLLSGGQKQRVAIAGILAMEPSVLILDEPTAGLDPRGRDRILTMLEELHAREHTTVLMVSHSMEDMARLATRLLVISEGRLAADGTPREIFSRPGLMTSVGLDIPEAARLCGVLRSRGYNLPEDLYRPEELREHLLRLWKEAAKC